MDEPTAEDLARSAEADLAVCDRATRGPLEVTNTCDSERYCRVVKLTKMDRHYDQYAEHMVAGLMDRPDAEFFTLARSALPAWIRRYGAAEADRDEYRRLTLALVNAEKESGFWKAYLELRDHARGNGVLDIPKPVVQQILDRAEAAEAECRRWRSHWAARDRGHHDRAAGVAEDGCPYPAPANPEDETSERAWWGTGWRDADAHLRLAARLEITSAGGECLTDCTLAGLPAMHRVLLDAYENLRRRAGIPPIRLEQTG